MISATLARTKEFIRCRGADSMRLSKARDQFISERRTGGILSKKSLQPKSQQRYYFSITGLIDWLTATQSTKRQSGDSVLLFNSTAAREYILHRSSQDMSDYTLAVDCAALREFAKWGVRKRYWPQEAVEDMPRVSRPEAESKAMNDEQRDRVMALPLDGQDAVLRGLLYYLGGRASEIIGIKLGDIAKPSGADGTPGFIRLFGKGRRERFIPMHGDLWEILRPYLNELRGKPLNWPLLSKNDGTSWSYTMLRKRTLEWVKAAQVPGLTPHVFRHTFVTNVIEETNDLMAAQQLAGHKQITTTQGYASVVDKRRRAAVDSLPSYRRVHSPDSVTQGEPPNAPA